jgi:hypothetical protein
VRQNGNGKPPAPVVTKAGPRELEAMADEAARRILHVRSRAEAFEKLDRGELRGSAAEFEFKSLRYMLTHQ